MCVYKHRRAARCEWENTATKQNVQKLTSKLTFLAGLFYNLLSVVLFQVELSAFLFSFSLSFSVFPRLSTYPMNSLLSVVLLNASRCAISRRNTDGRISIVGLRTDGQSGGQWRHNPIKISRIFAKDKPNRSTPTYILGSCITPIYATSTCRVSSLR